MPHPRWRLKVTDSFCAAHALRHYQGKCERLHGHNYTVDVEVEGEVLTPNTELLYDFGDLKQLLRKALEDLDHQYLNEVPPFDFQNPSAENLARYIWRRLQPELPQEVRLYAVTVAEKNQQAATYQEY